MYNIIYIMILKNALHKYTCTMDNYSTFLFYK